MIKKKEKVFPVKYCPVCKRCYERGVYYENFPTLGLERKICSTKCEEVKK